MTSSARLWMSFILKLFSVKSLSLEAMVEGREDLCIDDANVHDPPEHILPPAMANSPQVVVGPQLDHAVHHANVLPTPL